MWAKLKQKLENTASWRQEETQSAQAPTWTARPRDSFNTESAAVSEPGKFLKVGLQGQRLRKVMELGMFPSSEKHQIGLAKNPNIMLGPTESLEVNYAGRAVGWDCVLLCH